MGPQSIHGVNQMQYKALKLYRPVNSIVLPPAGIDGKNVCFGFFGENVTFPQVYKFLNLKPVYMRYVFVPRITKPVRTYLTPQYKKVLLGFGLKSISGQLGEYILVHGQNFFIDFSAQIEGLVKKYTIKRYSDPKAGKFLYPLLSAVSGVPDDQYERTLLYCVSLDEPLSPKIMNRRSFLLYMLLLEWTKDQTAQLPFDKILMYFYGAKLGGKYVLLFDRNQKNSIGRVKQILLSMRMGEMDEEIDQAVDETSDEIADTSEITKDYPESDKEEMKEVVRKYIRMNPALTGFEDGTPPDNIDKEQIVSAAVFSNTIGDAFKAKELAKRLSMSPKKLQREIIDSHRALIIPSIKVSSVSRDPLVKASKPEDLTDGSNPKHILEKRKSDFKDTLVEDIIDAFKTLNTKNLSMKVHSVNIKTMKSPASELDQTIKDRYTIKLVDKEKKMHTVQVELPHLTEDGTFMVNGQKKVIVNQIVTYPIFFFKAYFGMFMSSYSAVKIHSKMLRKASYFICYMGGYKIPLLLYLSYKLGFDNVMKEYGIEYTLGDKKLPGTVYLPNGKYISFKTKDDVGEQMAACLQYVVTALPKSKFDLNSQDTWRETIEEFVGNRNCLYTLDQVWSNVVTPIEIKLLESRGDPTTIEGIIHYICKEIVSGRVDDRNGLGRQRIRTSEIFISVLQKQILAAYNEYEMKKRSGDDTATLRINATKTYSQVINSQNVQALENINPLEELSMMTRVTPVGIGGIPDKNALPGSALNVHETYFGNIDPLETPNGAGVGVQQQLTIGASITNIRGTFSDRTRSEIHPTDILSTGPAMIPFVESNEGARITMASGQIKQAIPLQAPEKPMIQSGFESIFTSLLSDSFIKKAPIDGVVEEVTERDILVKDTITGKIHTVDVTPTILKSGQGKNGLGLFQPIVKVGEFVKKDQIIAEGSNIKEGLISNGINLLAAFMPWKGYNFEDGMVVCESVAKKFVSLHVEEQTVYLKPDEDVEFITDIGSEVKKGGILITYSNALHDVESHRHLRSDGGKIVNIEIYSNIPEDEIPKPLLAIYKKFKIHYKLIRGDYPVGMFKEHDEKFEGILIKFVIQQALSLKRGDKINNRMFNKGVVAIIEKDEDMPLTPWGKRIEIIYNPLSVINRMNTGQLCELHTGLISWKLGQLISTMQRDEFQKTYFKVIDMLDGTTNKEYSRNIVKAVTALSDVGYRNLVEHVKKDGFISLIFVPFKSPPRENIGDALKFLGLSHRYSLHLPEYNVDTDPVSVGYLYVVKLEHISEKKIASRGVGPYVGKTSAPSAGRKRDGGQKMGEYDFYSLLAWDCPILVDEFFGPLSADHSTKNEMISEIIQSGSTNFKATRMNPVKDLFANLMTAVHLTAI